MVVIYASREQLAGDMKWRDMLKSEVFQRRLRDSDRAHTHSGKIEISFNNA